MNPYMVAGAVSGAAGLLVFLLLHHVWIQPIWFIAPVGLAIALLGGSAVGWAYETLRPGMPAEPWAAPALAGLIVLILLPALTLAQVRAPIYRFEAGSAVRLASTGRIVLIFITDLLATSAVMGWLAGLAIGGTREAALRTAIAGLVFALGPGHNIPLISGQWGAVFKSWVLLFVVIAISAVVLVGLVAALARAEP